MTAPSILILFAVLVGSVGSRRLSRASWPARAPGLAIFAWQAMTISVFLSLTLAGLALSVPKIPASEGLAGFFHACSAALRAHYATPGGAVISAGGAALAVGLIVGLSRALLRGSHIARRDRAHQHRLVRLVCKSHPEPDVAVVQVDLPAVYCLPGRVRQVVVTEGALDVLTPDQLLLVLAHERAHIRARHHLALLAAQAFAGALFGRLGSKVACEQIAELVEMHADDAVEGSQRKQLASALVVLGGAVEPAGALGAAGGSALARVRRLATPMPPVRWPQRFGLVGLTVLTVVVPLFVVVAPAVSTVLVGYCPVLRA